MSENVYNQFHYPGLKLSIERRSYIFLYTWSLRFSHIWQNPITLSQLILTCWLFFSVDLKSCCKLLTLQNTFLSFFWRLRLFIRKTMNTLKYWQTLSRSPKSKSKSRLMTGFLLKLDFPTTQPLTQPPTQESFKEAR